MSSTALAITPTDFPVSILDTLGLRFFPLTFDLLFFGAMQVSKDQKARAKKSDLHFFFNQTCFPLQGLDSIVSTHSSEDSGWCFASLALLLFL